MSRKVLDSHIGDNDIDVIMNDIIAQNPQLNAQIEKVHNENNIFLCEILRIYPYEDKGLVKVLNNNKNIFCRLSHEILGNGMSIDYVPRGRELIDNVYYKGRKYIKPYDDLYGIVAKVRWENIEDENVLLGYVNIHDNNDLMSSNNSGELSLKSGSSIISVDDERVNIMTPSLFINGLPYDEPELLNYYDKTESDIITNSLTELINQNKEDTEHDISDINDKLNHLEIGDIDYANLDVDFNLNFGLSGQEDLINVDIFLKQLGD